MGTKEEKKKLGLAIVGGGTGGLALLKLFHQETNLKIIGIADLSPEAPAIQYAKTLSIPTTTNFKELIEREGVDLIVDVTGNPDVNSKILKEKAPHVELLGGISAGLMWNFIELLEGKVAQQTQELKEVQQELLRNRLTMLQELSSGVSHQLRNPLGVIKNAVQYLSNKVEPHPKMKKQIEIIGKEVHTAERIIDDLVSFINPADEVGIPQDTQQEEIQSEKLAQIGIIAAGIAHEVNNPLSVMLGKAEMILDEDDLERVRKYALDIISYAKRASEIVTGITFYSRAASGPGSSRQRININDQLREALTICRYSTNFDAVGVSAEYELVPMISGSGREMQQVFINLMSNAVQAMKGSGRLSISSRLESESVVVTIRDTGPGIKKEHLNKLFTPFFTTKDPGAGTGLGLNIVHKIIKNHGGTITVKSREDEGAAFIMRFPALQEAPKAKAR